MSVATAGRRLTLVSRADCELCDHFLDALNQLQAQAALPPIARLDVDGDPVLQRRWGLKVPVLLLDGALVCWGRLDSAELLRILQL